MLPTKPKSDHNHIDDHQNVTNKQYHRKDFNSKNKPSRTLCLDGKILHKRKQKRKHQNTESNYKCLK